MSYTGSVTSTGTGQREVIHDHHLSYLTQENRLIKKYLIIGHVAVFTTISTVIFVIVTDLLGFIIIDILIQCICVALMNKSYDKWYKRICCGSVFIFDLFEECSHWCDRDGTLDETMIHRGYGEEDATDTAELQSFSTDTSIS